MKRIWILFQFAVMVCSKMEATYNFFFKKKRKTNGKFFIKLKISFQLPGTKNLDGE